MAGWPVYSERLLHHQEDGWWSYVVPQGMRCVLTQLDAVCAATPPANVSLTIGPILLESFLFPEQWAPHKWTGRAVAYQGEEIQLGISVAGIHCTLSGYLFADSSGRTGPPASTSQLPAPAPPQWWIDAQA